jgi:hypothetical protein
MATLTTGGLMGDDPLTNGASFIRPIGHRIYVPMKTSFANPTRVQAGFDEDEKKQHPPPRYENSNLDLSLVNVITTS